MLYERWRQVAHENRGETALRDLSTGRYWSFRQLADAAERYPATSEPVAFPQGLSAEFILSLLSAWREGQVVCPLEVEQKAPELELPAKRIVHLKSTSGSSSASRIVRFRAEQLIADSVNIVETMGLRPEWPNLGTISLAHSYGFSNLVLPCLLNGIPLVLLASSLPESLRKALPALDAVTLPAVPALWRAWFEAKAVNSSIRLAISAGAPLLVSLEQQVYASTGLKIHNFYGASECGGIAYDSTGAPRTDSTFVGPPMRNVSLSAGSDGCLRVESAAVGETYWPQPQGALHKGCFQTGDRAEIVEGVVHLRGRANDLINVAGRKVAPETIESVLRLHPHVRDCLVFSVPQSQNHRTEVIVACVETSSPAEKDNLKAFLLKHLPPWQVPREWWFTDLDRSTRGKLSRTAWRERYVGRNGCHKP